MADHPDPQAPPAEPNLPEELGASLGSVWARYAGSRPSGATVDIDGSVVRWVLPGGTTSLEAGLAGSKEEAGAGRPALTRRGYERDTSAAVARATGRHVGARFTKRDNATGASTETFVLEVPLRRY